MIIGAVTIYYRSMQDEPTGLIQLEPCSGTLTILYDNYLYDSDCSPEWGFSCLIETDDTVILFDTGGDPNILSNNIEALNVDISLIDCIVISHEHWDHIGGIEVILSQKPGLPVYVPEGFPYHIKSSIRSMGGNCVETINATMICDSVCTTNTLNGPPLEQALMIKTEDGIILVTGCSHPGIENLARNAFELTGESIQLAIGGYHLGSSSASQLNAICDELDEIGVLSVAATHCTGDSSIEYFRERYGGNFIESGVGFNIGF